MDTIEILIAAWVKAKAEEQGATEWRRKTEDRIIRVLNLAPEFEGTENYEIGDIKLKVVGRHNRKIDADKLQDLAAEHGLSEHLGALFRWKPDINAAAWKAADDSITKLLLDAITTSPGRPSFSVTQKDQ